VAGDVGIHEQIVVHSEGVGEAPATAEAITTISGGVTHEYGPRVVIGAIPPTAEPSVRAQVYDAGLAEEPEAIAEDMKSGLDEVGALGLDAFALRQSSEYAAAKAERPKAGEEWDEEDMEPPDLPDEHGAEAPAMAAAAAGAATSARLTGKVAVGLIIVEGPTAALKFSADERTKVVAEVQNGLSWLGSQSSPAGISWTYDIRVVTLNRQPNANDTTREQKEARWRDPAMQQLGYAAGLAGVRAYVEDLRTRLKTDWAYCCFFVKYPLGHFAYASIGGPRIVMHYENDGWGPENIDRVFAHETGHIFRAPDEYAASNCDCGGQWGHFGVPNSNCASCAPNGGVACIMKSNDWAMCPYTPYHLGFPQGLRYSGAFLPGTDSHGLWVNADWPSFQAKWQAWSNQGLRLVDLEVTEIGGQVRYSGVFRAGSGAYGLWVNADWASFQSKWQQWSGQGMRLVDLEISQIGGQTRYSGVFRAGSGAYGLWVNADWASFQSKWQQWSGQGLRLVDLEISQIGGQPRYSGVFRAGSGAYALWVNADWPSFQAKWQQWSAQGLRLTDLEVLQIAGQARYSGVFAAGTGGHALWADAAWPSFLNKWKQLSDQGLRLVDFASRPTGIEVAASQVASLVADSADGAGSGFAAVGGVALGRAADTGGTALGADDRSGAGFGEILLPSPSAQAGEASAEGLGDLVLIPTPRSADDLSPQGFGELVVAGMRRQGDDAGVTGSGDASFEPGQVDETDPSGFGSDVVE
jgi:hypothetical protein